MHARHKLGDMDSRPVQSSSLFLSSAQLPGWALPRGREPNESDAAFAAGIALKSLDDLVNAEPRWAGC